MIISLHLQSSDQRSFKQASISFCTGWTKQTCIRYQSHHTVCLCLKPSLPQSPRATNPLLLLRPSGIAGSVAPESVPVSVLCHWAGLALTDGSIHRRRVQAAQDPV